MGQNRPENNPTKTFLLGLLLGFPVGRPQGTVNANDLVTSVEAFALHLTGKQKLTLRTATMPLPPPVKPLTSSQVRSIRKKLNVSQSVFAAMMNIPIVTAASWERGRRTPTGAALRLLDIASKHPEVLLAG